MANADKSDDRRNDEDLPRSSQLFLLRVWIDRKKMSPESDGLAGKVQNPVTGQVQYFRGGVELIRLLRRLVIR